MPEPIVFDLTTPPSGWRDLDLSLLEERRTAVPRFPIDLLPQAWADWIGDTATSGAAPVDYVAQSVLAAVAAVCGAEALCRTSSGFMPTRVARSAIGGFSGRGPKFLRRYRGTSCHFRRSVGGGSVQCVS